MVGIDTNVLVRFIVRDDPSQTRRADRLLDNLTKENPGFVSSVVLAETIWVLQSNYRMPKSKLMSYIEKLIQSRNLVLENELVVRQALDVFRDSKADFSDCHIERTCSYAGCSRTVTFDEDAAKSAGMILI
ncbi:MAG TPA: type II toxin-antitoxin system VapC family toxin [Terracidiphilus sp.]|jgi:predicted nucleic-acid-binding protein